MKIKENVTMYYCDHCNKKLMAKYAMIRHEAICSMNPENKRPCFMCRHINKRPTEVCFDTPLGGELTRIVEVLHCNKKDIFLYPPKVEYKQNAYELETNSPMPKTCDEFLPMWKSDF